MNALKINKNFSNTFKSCKKLLRRRPKMTFILTIYNPNEDDINYWIDAYNSMKSLGFYFHWVFDQEVELSEYNLISPGDLYPTNTNIGKFRRVLSHVKHNVDTPYFKTLDPDDRINLEELKKFIFPKKNNLIISNGFFNITENKKIINPSTFWTASTILPSKKVSTASNIFYEMDNNIINFSEDQLLATMALRAKAKVKFINKPFYEHKMQNGVSVYDHDKNYREFLIIYDLLTKEKKNIHINTKYEKKWILYTINNFRDKTDLNKELVDEMYNNFYHDY